MPISLLLSVLPQWSKIDVPILNYVVSFKQASASIVQPLLNASDIALVIWSAGVVALLGILLTAHHRFLKTLTPMSDSGALPPSIAGLKVFSGGRQSSPCVVGFLRPVLVLPKDFQQRFSASQQYLILRHELLHKQRGDLFANLLAQCVLILFWFNPFVWKGYQVFRQTQELACDEAVLSESDKTMRVDYAKAMLMCAGSDCGRFSTSLHYGGKDDLHERLNNIKQIDTFSQWRWGVVGSSLLIALTLFHSVSADNQNKDDLVYAISRVEPVYPVEAADQGMEGSVVLSFDINLEGQVENVEVVESNPGNVFDKASKVALRQWLYTKPPQTLKGVLVQLDFKLDQSPSELETD